MSAAFLSGTIARARLQMALLAVALRSAPEEFDVHQNTSVVPTARHWGVTRQPNRSVHYLIATARAEFLRWVPLMLEMMDPSVSRKPPDKALLRPARVGDHKPEVTRARRSR